MGAAHLRYGGLSGAGKKALVDELVVITGYHRKSVLRALNRRPISADGDDISAEPHRYPEQRILIVRLNGYVYLVPFVETDEHFFLKTIIPSRKENCLQKPSTPTETPS
jgi:hypothetical protein